jgi:putative ABC transport system substrate-binding protein
MNRRVLLATAFAAASAPMFALGARGDEPEAKRRLCVLTMGEASDWIREWAPVLLNDLGPFGFSQRNLALEVCAAESFGLALDQCAAKLVRSGCDAIFTQGTNQTRALQRATNTLPILTAVGDPVGSGFAATLAKPGGNITGLSFATVEANSKLLEFARLMIGPFSAITILGHPGDALVRELSKRIEGEVRGRGIAVRLSLNEAPAGVEREFKAMSKRGERVVLAYYLNELAPGYLEAITESAARNRIALVTNQVHWVRAGALLAYATLFRNQNERQATQIARVLRGAKPGDTPFELPESIELAVNSTTASKLGIKVPQEILILATEIIGS